MARDPLCKGDAALRVIGIKTYLDGGMLTGSAYMREPWGVSSIYGITDPQYRGLLFISKDRLTRMVTRVRDPGVACPILERLGLGKETADRSEHVIRVEVSP